MKRLARILAPTFAAGFEYRRERVVYAAPIIRYMLGWPLNRVRAYCAKKKWRLELLDAVKD